MANKQPVASRSPMGVYLRSPMGVRSQGGPSVLAALNTVASGMYSANATTWKSSTGTTPSLGICWSPSLKRYCAIGGYSDDGGKTWVPTTMPSGNWTSICWSPTLNIFCAVANSGGAGGGTQRVATSSNGITWVSQTDLSPVGKTRAWSSVCWSETALKFVATQPGRLLIGEGIMTSPDGATWTGQTRATDPVSGGVIPAGRVVYGNGVYCSIASAIFFGGAATDGMTQVSADGVTWNPGSAPEAHVWTGIAYSPTLNVFAMVAATGTNRIATGSNGTTWTPSVAPEANNWTDICWSPVLGLFVAVATSGTHRVMTWDGVNPWQLQTAASALGWQAIAAKDVA